MHGWGRVTFALLAIMGMATIMVLLGTVASEEVAAEGPSMIFVSTPKPDYWIPNDNVTFDWWLTPDAPQVDFHLVLWDPNGTRLVNVTGSNGTSYHYGHLQDMWGYNWTLSVNYTSGGRNWTNSTGLYTFGVDSVPPENPTHAVMGNGTHTSGVWNSNESTVVIWVFGAHDNLSGVEGYEVYWGPNPRGKPIIIYTETRFFLGTTPECIWYLRLRSIDRAYNKAETVTIYIHMHDALPPLNPDSADQLNGSTESDVWQNKINSPRFKWEEPYDQTSGVAGYQVYMGPDPNGTSEEFITNRTWEPGPVTDGTYHLRLSPVDLAGNEAPWTTVHVFRYDATPPGPVTIGCTAGNLSVTGEATFLWTVPTDLSGISRYRYRLNDGAGTWVTSPAAPFEDMRDRHHVFGVAAVDGAGNMGEWSFVNLTVDTTPPNGSVVFDVTGIATNLTLPLLITAFDATTGVEAMRFSPNGIEWGDWDFFRPTGTITLPPGDGMKAVQLQLRDAAGHVSTERMVDSVLLDTTDPVGELLLNGGATNTTSPTVTINVTAEDINGIVGLRIGEDSSEWGDVLDPFDQMPHTLTPGDGVRTVRVMLIDGAGLTTILSASILLDTVPPAGTVLVNGGDEYSNSSTVDLSLWAEDATSGVVEMRLSWNGTTWGPWENFTEVRLLYALAPGDGERSVHVQLRDGVSLVSDVVIVDTVLVDTYGPTGSVLIEGGEDSTRFYTVDLTFTATDANGVTDMRISWDGETWTGWEAFKTSKTVSMPGGDGIKTVFVEYRDSSGRVSEVPVTDSIEYERIGNLTIGLLALALCMAILVALVYVRRKGQSPRGQR